MDPKVGGPCQGIRNSIPAMKTLGVENEVVCLDSPNAKYIDKDTFKIHALGLKSGPWGYSKFLIPWLKTHSKNYDAIIIHGLWQFISYAVYKALRGIDESPPYFVMPHGMLDPYFQKAPERRLKAIRNWIFWKYIESKVVNNAKGVLFTCEEELILAREAFANYHPKAELNVGYGIQTPPELTKKMSEAFFSKCVAVKGKPFLLFLSRIHQKKGVNLLIEAFKRHIENENTELHLVIVGPGIESDYGNSLLQSVKNEYLVSSRIHFTGMLSGDAKWGAFYNADAFILPSHQENFGIAIVEALACNIPVLISDKVNIWREIKSNNAGFIANDDVFGAYELISQFENLDVKAKTVMKHNALSTFKEFYSIKPAAEKLTQTIKSSINYA